MNCVAPATAHGIGHNSHPQPEPFGIRSAWLRFANAVELRRLAKLHVRVKVKERALKDVIAAQANLNLQDAAAHGLDLFAN